MNHSEISADIIRKYKGRSISWLLKKATEVFNRYIRERDSEDGYFQCISCGRYKPIAKMHAGHFKPAGLHTVVRFHEDNVHGQCGQCNTFRGGNLNNYREGLIKKIGLERVEMVEMLAKSTRVDKKDRFNLIWIIETYKQKIKQI